LPQYLYIRDCMVGSVRVVQGCVEADLVAVRVVRLRQDPAERGEVDPGFLSAEAGVPRSDLLEC
jgi:hypothetical protein